MAKDYPSLGDVDLSSALEREDYKVQLRACQARMQELSYTLYRQKRLLVMAFEGWDAAGKGGSIRRLTEPLDPRGYNVYAIAAPAGEDKTHHYLWRFWRRIESPMEKQVLIFDRSWYGRVLVERVEGFATNKEWKRAYQEINDFEREFTDSDAIVVKYWFHISPEEQLKRFKARKVTPHKRWKLTDEDWRNRDKWDDYHDAVDDMLKKTHCPEAPWLVIPGNDKLFARVETQRRLIAILEDRL